VLSQVVKNVHRILNVCDLPDVPVYVGCAKPLLSDPVNAEAFHGEDGLGDVPHIHPAPEHLQNPEHNSTSASLALIQAAQKYAGKLTVVALGKPRVS
jgi:inosine-uridine nucleoside N-ribohydrolase